MDHPYNKGVIQAQHQEHSMSAAAPPIPKVKPKYISRKYQNRMDTEIICTAIEAKQNTLLLGPAGTGKTTLGQVVAYELGRPIRYVPCHTGGTVEALIGQWIPNPNPANGKGAYIWMDGLVTKAVRNGEILFLDEVNSLKPEVTFSLHGLLDYRRELVLMEKPTPDGELMEPEVIQAAEGFGVIAAGNPTYEGVRVMNEAFRDRFQIQLYMGYLPQMDIAVLNALPILADLDKANRAAIEGFIKKVRQSAKSGNIHTDISTRAFIDFGTNLVLQGFMVAEILFCSRYDDPGEVSHLKTCFREHWDEKGAPVGGGQAIEAKKGSGGRAGKFGPQKPGSTASTAAADAGT